MTNDLEYFDSESGTQSLRKMMSLPYHASDSNNKSLTEL